MTVRPGYLTFLFAIGDFYGLELPVREQSRAGRVTRVRDAFFLQVTKYKKPLFLWFDCIYKRDM